MRQNYVDVLNNSGATTKTNVPPEALFPAPFEQPATNLFIPPPPGISVYLKFSLFCFYK